jgi:hypothetical protein
MPFPQIIVPTSDEINRIGTSNGMPNLDSAGAPHRSEF